MASPVADAGLNAWQALRAQAPGSVPAEALEAARARVAAAAPARGYPLTALQQDMLHHTLVASGRTAYHQQLLARFDGVLDTARLRRAWSQVVARHDALRGRFVRDHVSQPLHLVPGQEPPRLEVVVIGSETVPDEALAPVIEAALARDLAHPFQPHRERPMRLRLLRAGPRRHWLLWSFHHLLLDGRSVSLVLEEVLDAYRRDAAPGVRAVPVAGATPGVAAARSLAAATPVAAAEPGTPASALADWHRWRLAQDPQAARRHWQAMLAGLDAGAALSVGTGRGADAMAEVTERVLLDGPLLESATELAASTHATLQHVVLAAWGVAVAWSRGRRDVVFGSVLDGRDAPVPGVDRLVGMLLTAVPVRVRWQPGEGLRTLLARVRNEALEAQALPQGALSEAVSPEGLRASELVDHLVRMPQWPGGELAQPVCEGVTLSALDFRESLPFGLGVWMRPCAQGWELLLRSRTASCGPARLAVLAWLLRTVLVEGLAQPELSLELLAPSVPAAAAPAVASQRAATAPPPATVAAALAADAGVLARL